MKTLVFGIFLVLTVVGYSQPYIDLVMSVRDDQTEELIDNVWVRFFEGDELVDSDSSGSMWGGDGHLKGFWLEWGHKYTFIISKDGYVTKRGEIDLTNPKLEKEDKAIHLSLFVTLFPYCSAGNYDFLKSTPLIKIFLNDEGEQDWDRDYVKRMQKRIDEASHANVSDTDYQQHNVFYKAGVDLMDDGKYKEAKEKFLKAHDFMDCYKVQRAILECEERMAGLYDKDVLVKIAAEKYDAREWELALKYYKRLDKLFDFEEEEELGTLVNRRVRYLKSIIRADQFMLDRNLYMARDFYEMASWVFDDGDPYAESRIKIIDNILEKKE